MTPLPLPTVPARIPERPCVGEGCPSNDHVNGDRDYSPHKHSDPGYCLNHRWLG